MLQRSPSLEALDDTTTGAFLPYRDAQDRPRLFDVRAPARSSTLARKLYRRASEVLKRGLDVTCEAEYRSWYLDHWLPLDEEIFDNLLALGTCAGDEGRALRDLLTQIVDVVHRPGWRVE